MDIEKRLLTCHKVYQTFYNVLNSYVSDYYVENHWNKLSTSWSNHFEEIKISELSDLLNLSKPLNGMVHPLTLLCLRSVLDNFTLPRRRADLPISPEISPFKDNKKFMNFFWKNVKLKKRHEIDIMAKLCYRLAKETNCFHIVDIGSGVGHLSRMLSYGYGIKVCTVEAVEAFTKLAESMDSNFENALTKRNICHIKNTFKTVHINKRITKDITVQDFLTIVQNAFDNKNVRFGIVGLHPCGDLGATLLKLYMECPNIVFINIASCCYMKITLNPTTESCFPLSNFCKAQNIVLSYLVCEIACHAIENYSEKLKNDAEYEKLKIHAYRAALEDLLTSVDPELKHSIVGSVKYTDNLTFVNYVKKVCDNNNLPNLPDEKVLFYEDLITTTWRKVVSFYSIRLLLAPLVENIILLDRWLYVTENGSECKILPLFDCNISPRNLVLSANKRKDV
ncbi:methyltransferase-like protein 25B [Diabrotica virgifera virgifera]|uniref:Protein RRNAD1-like n=1 Tax=Diabrotica virgifera virgifera TaxID=50390 RepID=A0A6P7FG35_DIAVI|nr:methyltransferase-like protein 25B [Diabrotica virgifera virgifera]